LHNAANNIHARIKKAAPPEAAFCFHRIACNPRQAVILKQLATQSVSEDDNNRRVIHIRLIDSFIDDVWACKKHVMSGNSAFRIYVNAQEYSVSFTYRGPFHESLTERVVDISENTIANNQGLPRINRKVSFLLVECFQNIIKHGEKLARVQHGKNEEGLFSFKNVGSVYVINSINVIKNEEVEVLKEMVDQINLLSKEELRNLYKKQLVENELSHKGGAGLGLIELARKSGQKLEYEFEVLDEGLQLFHQQVMFNREEDNHVGVDFISPTRTLYKELEKSEILLSYKGDFSQKSILPILNIVESNIGRSDEEMILAKKVGHVLIEMLQNISRLAADVKGIKDGIFLIGKTGDRFFVQAGNIMEPSKAEVLQKWLGSLSAMSKENLRKVHKDKIKSSIKLSDKSRSGLGLIQIAKVSASPIEYQFDQISEDKMFFSLYVIV
jgi:hypothetical protein